MATKKVEDAVALEAVEEKAADPEKETGAKKTEGAAEPEAGPEAEPEGAPPEPDGDAEALRAKELHDTQVKKAEAAKQNASKILRNAPKQGAVRPGEIVTIDRDQVAEDVSDESDIAWHDLRNSQIRQKILSGCLTGVERHSVGESLNVWIAVVTYKGYRVMIPLSEMNISSANSGDTEKRLTRIAGSMVGSEIDFIVTNTDENGRAVTASRAKAMAKKCHDFYIEKSNSGEPIITPGRVVEARITGVGETLVRLEVFGAECFVRAFELMDRWVADARDEARFAIGNTINVRVTGVDVKDNGDIKVSVEGKSLEASEIHRCEKQGKYVGEITGFNRGTYFLRLDIGANAVAQQYDACDRPPKKKDKVHFVCTAWDENRQTAGGIITRIISPYKG